MPNVKVQHQVPRSYLSRWTGPGKQLYVFDKVKGRSFRANIENIACERFFYDLPSSHAAIDPQCIEKALQLVEDEFKKAIDDLLSGGGEAPIVPEQRDVMGFFLATQLLRTRSYRDFHIRVAEEILSRISQLVLSAKVKYGGLKLKRPLDSYRVQYDERYASVDQAASMFSPDSIAWELAEEFRNRIWVIGANNTSQPFYTSDNPVAWTAHKQRPGRGCGLKSEGVEIAFPLDPTHVLVLFERTYFRDLEPLDGGWIEFPIDAVRYHLELQISQSCRQVYSASEDFTFALEFCKNNPCKGSQLCL